MSTIREWIEDPGRLPCAKSIGADGYGTLEWRFVDQSCELQSGSTWHTFEHKLGPGHPDGQTRFLPLGVNQEQALRTLETLGVPLDLVVKPLPWLL